MPDDPDAIFQQRLALARKLSEQRQFGDAIVLFNWLCEIYPDRAAAVIDSANAFSRVFDYAGVKMRFDTVEARGTAPTPVWLAMAEISHRLQRPQWARRFLNQAVGQDQLSAQACGLLSIHLEHANELAQATQAVDRGLKQDPTNATCQLAKARLYRREKSIDQAMQAIAALLKNESADLHTRISALYEKANLHDTIGEYGKAVESLRLAKQLATTASEYALSQQRSLVSQKMHHQFLTSLTDFDFGETYFQTARDWKPSTPHRIALLGGHPRSGTTLLEQILDSHTGIISAEETAVFGNGVYDPFTRELTGNNVSQASLEVSSDRLEQFRAAYFSTIESVLDAPIGNRFLIDKNPSYTDCIPVFARVFPEASFIIALRDPRDVVLSCFFQDLPVNDVTIHFHTLKETAMRYANTMAMWLVCRENLDEKKWIEVRYESLVTDLPGEAKKVMQHLNLPWQHQQSDPHEHARARIVASPTYAQVAQPVHGRAVGRWKNYQSWLGEAMPILETFIEAFEY